MIIIISEKMWRKKAKKFAEIKDYVICDATSDDSGPITKYSNVVNMDGLAIPSKLIKVADTKKDRDYDDDDILDKNKAKKMEKRFFKKKDFRISTMAILKSLLTHEEDLNIFVVVKNKAYKTYAAKLKKEMNKVIESGDLEIIYLYDEVEEDKKILKRNIKQGERKRLMKNLKKLQVEMEK